MRILLVEDEIKLANAMKRALELQAYAVDVVNSGNEGLDLALGEDFDLILLDVMLPGLNGIEICNQLRKEGRHTPILILTAKGQIEDKISGLDMGADDYMVKPFSFEELFARIRALMRRPKHTAETILTYKELRLDPNKFSVKVDGKDIQLSAKEFALLEYLLRNKNMVVTREQIIAHIWNYDANILPSTVEVHIKNLRDKIESGGKKNLIKTVRGRGYSIKDD